MSDSFSKRRGYHRIEEKDISVRLDAPHEFRGVLIELAYDCTFRPRTLRTLVCRVLRTRPDESNWSEYPNIDQEIRWLVDSCEWYRVYDIVEKMAEKMMESQADKFQNELNEYFIENGIGWQLNGCRVESRGPRSFEKTVESATDQLEQTDQSTAQQELHEAISDLSRRPDPDITGAIQHSMAALECVSREVAGDRTATIGQILKRYPELIPSPIDVAIEKLWGYASEYGRHIREGREPAFSEAQLVVGICAATITYLLKKDV
ncbi:MAG: hypothetical protein IH859_09345 [Chloroflexi bacterium]|nr:hypothetical protein [Chloroflexota bacterium]